ncbi:MAG: homocysteine S-methyltransferase family protein [Candidatus Latescibacterota bacterium]|nr:MAG: homocysteine S-methyltransferase family protein [Candidatus Latescibacterota bacterium]
MTVDTDILSRLRKGRVLFDGGLGTMLIAKGLQPGMPPEEWNRTRPSLVREIHSAYLDAGADVIETNTFGGTPFRLTSYGVGDMIGEINTTGVRLAKEAVEEFSRGHNRSTTGSSDPAPTAKNPKRYVALSLGPTGMMMQPLGNFTENEIKTEFVKTMKSTIGTIDLILIETIYDLREGLLALEAVKSVSETPVAVSLTFNKNPRGYFTVMGDEAGESIKKLTGAGADVVGANCTITSTEMTELAVRLRENTDLPILCQPNAGQPTIRDGAHVYEQRAEEFAQHMIDLYDVGINAAGGCCGTTPDFIREVSIRLQNYKSSDAASAS